MNTRTIPTATVQEEPHLYLSVGYSEGLAIPASLASQILPHVRVMRREYNNTGHTYHESPTEGLTINLLTGEQVAAARTAMKIKEAAATTTE